jgi:hypothetical protein
LPTDKNQGAHIKEGADAKKMTRGEESQDSTNNRVPRRRAT